MTERERSMNRLESLNINDVVDAKILRPKTFNLSVWSEQKLRYAVRLWVWQYDRIANKFWLLLQQFATDILDIHLLLILIISGININYKKL